MRNRSFMLVLLTVCTTVVGCGQRSGQLREQLSTVPASGVLTYQGKPLEGYEVTFIPKQSDRPSAGKTDADGRFTLGTNELADGAPVGTYTVVVAFNAVSPLDPAVVTPEQIAASTPKPKVKIPAKYSSPEKSGLQVEVPEGGSTELKIELKD